MSQKRPRFVSPLSEADCKRQRRPESLLGETASLLEAQQISPYALIFSPKQVTLMSFYHILWAHAIATRGCTLFRIARKQETLYSGYSCHCLCSACTRARAVLFCDLEAISTLLNHPLSDLPLDQKGVQGRYGSLKSWSRSNWGKVPVSNQEMIRTRTCANGPIRS